MTEKPCKLLCLEEGDGLSKIGVLVRSVHASSVGPTFGVVFNIGFHVTLIRYLECDHVSFLRQAVEAFASDGDGWLH